MDASVESVAGDENASDVAENVDVAEAQQDTNSANEGTASEGAGDES
jgi:hypothetical protein